MLLLIGVAGFSSWFVYQQSQKLKQVNQQESEVYTQDVASDEHSENSAPDSNASAAGEKGALRDSEPAGEGNATPGVGEPAGEDNPLTTKIQDVFLTSFVVKDAAEYFVSHYYPAESRNNPGPEGTLDVSFKTLNARYGLELVGVKNTDMPLDKAREKVLSFLMDPGVLQRSYELAADDFIRSLIHQAENSDSFSAGPASEGQSPTGSRPRVSEFLRLVSRYLRDVGAVLEALSADRKSASLVQAYLRADQEATQAHYTYNQKTYALENFVKQAEESPSEIPGQEGPKLEQLRAEKQAAAEAFRQAIQERERIRQELMSLITSRTGAVRLDSHDILYLAKWVQRRMEEGDNRSALQVAAGLLRVLSQELQDAAVEYRQVS